MIKDISTQLWIGRKENKELSESLFTLANNDGGLKIKGGGGLWTSTFLGEKKGSDWIQWCLGNSFSVPENDIWKGYLITPKKNLRVYTVDSLTEMHMLFDNYGFNPYPTIPQLQMEGIDFVKLAEDYDALHVTEHGEMVTRHGFSFFKEDFFGENLKAEWKAKKMRNLYGWDCESYFHLKWNFETIEPIELKIECEENEIY